MFTAHGSYGAIHGGFIGVEVFFVLSGYLITALLIAEYGRNGRVSVRHFYLRRAARLLPALGLATLLVVGLYASDPTIRPVDGVVSSIWKVWLYVANWFIASHQNLGLLNHAWSLSIEEQFYLLWPLVFIVALKRGLAIRRVAVLVCGVALLSYLARYAIARHDLAAASYRSDARAGALLVGCGLALALSQSIACARITRYAGANVAAVALMVLIVSVFSLEQARMPAYEGGMLVVAIATAIIIAHIVLCASRLTRILAHPALVWTGRRSYGLYLYHFSIFVYFTDVRLGVGGHALELVVRLLLTFALAAASYRLVERPVLDLTRRLTTPPRGVAPSEEPALVRDETAGLPTIGGG